MQTFQSAILPADRMLVVARPMPMFSPAVAVAAVPAPVSAAAISAVAVTTPVNQIRYIDPGLAAQIVRIRPTSNGFPRDQITVPIASSADVTDDMLFADPADPAKHSYLPQYALAEEQTAAGTPRYSIAVRQSGTEWTLVIRLSKSAPPSLGDAARAASEIKHSVAIFLRYNLVVAGASAAISEEPFDELSTDSNLVSATMRLPTLAQRDAVVRALSESGSGAQLVVRRSVDVAIPVPPAPAVPPRPASPATRPVPMKVGLPLRAVMADAVVRADIATATATAAAPRAAPLFRQVTRVLDCIAEPANFTFPPTLHPYIYGDLGVPGGASQALIRQGVTWHGEDQSYYQHPYDTWLFYYLPDSFKLVRRSGAPRDPLMQLSFLPAPAGTAVNAFEQSHAVLDYVAAPVVDTGRLADAALQLKHFMSNPLPQGVDGPRFVPLVIASERLKLRLRLPGASGFTERANANVNLRSGIKDTIDLPLSEFQSVFDSLFGAGLTLFTGDVVFDLGDGTGAGAGAGESIPFTARLEDMSGDVVDFTATPEGEGLRVILRNAVESPVSIAQLVATLQRGSQSVPAIITGSDPAIPVKLAPGATFGVLLTPAAPLAGDSPLTAVFDLSSVTVAPDREAIYGEILDPATPTGFSRTIHVVTGEERFKTGEMARIVVEFEDGATVDLHPGHIEGDAEVQRPIADFVLRRASTGSYRYRLQTLPANGAAPTVGEWREASSDIVLV